MPSATPAPKHTLLSDSALELLRQASQGVPRKAGVILKIGMQLAMNKGLNHLPDDIIQHAIEELL
jgi:MSHA biogenesis protein MshM